MTRISILLCATSCFAVVVGKPTQAGASSADVQHTTSVTLSPLHLGLPVVEVTGEFRLNDQMGAAGIIGVGSVKNETTNETWPVLELGGQFRYYLLGSFIHGMQIGAEALYVRVSAEEGSVSAVGSGLIIGPFVGYKIATNVGFTFEIQMGYSWGLLQGEAEDSSTGASASGEEAFEGAIANINLGWSF